ncbi:MAG: FMN-binding protein [Acidimicrobiia bacterium]
MDIKGPAIPTRWGTVQVEVVVQDGRLVDVIGVQLPTERQYSAYVSSVAGPWLRDEALAAQSADIQNISGATYTSQGYARSLQSALDTAGL